MPLLTLTQRPRLLPKGDRRVNMKVSPEAREMLARFLLNDVGESGIGFSEFIMQSVVMWREIAAETTKPNPLRVRGRRLVRE